MAVEELFDAAYFCTGCRRCMVYRPFGIDTQMIMSIARLSETTVQWMSRGIYWGS
jgi:Fe-S oxidoreductase